MCINIDVEKTKRYMQRRKPITAYKVVRKTSNPNKFKPLIYNNTGVKYAINKYTEVTINLYHIKNTIQNILLFGTSGIGLYCYTRKRDAQKIYNLYYPSAAIIKITIQPHDILYAGHYIYDTERSIIVAVRVLCEQVIK